MTKILLLDFYCTVSCSHFFKFLTDFPEFQKGWGQLLDKYNIFNPQKLAQQFEDRTKPLDLTAIKNLVFCGQNRIDLLKRFFDYLQANNIIIGISSQGGPNTILTLLDIAGLKNYISFLVTGGDTSGKMSYTPSDKFGDASYVKPNFDSLQAYIAESYLRAKNGPLIVYVNDEPTINEQVPNYIVKYFRDYDWSIFRENYKFIGGEELPKYNSTGIGLSIINKILVIFGLQPFIQQGGYISYYQKYLKYKTKYLNLQSNKN